MPTSKIHILLIGAASIVGLGFVMTSTTPDRLGPFGILLFFGLVMCAITIFFYLATSVFKPESAKLKRLELSLILSVAPVVLLALSSVDQLRVADVILISLFEVVVIFYTSRTTSNRGKR